MKRALTLLLSFLLFVRLPLPIAWAESNTEASSEPVFIDSVDAFLDFAESCARDSYSMGVSFALTADLDLSNTAFEAIPYFAGTFLGGGHTILGLSLCADGSRVGLFRQLAEGAQVKDLSVKGRVTPGGTGVHVGGIAGLNNGSIIHCFFEGSVSGTENVGGIVGTNGETGLVSDCRFQGDVTGEHQVGGIAGLNSGALSACVNSGSVNTVPVIPESEARFDLSSFSEDDFLNLSNLGGIAGENGGVLDDCRNTGDVGYKNTGYNVGGAAGKSSGYIRGCSNYGLVRGRRDVGGIAGQLIPYAVWDFSEGKLDALSAEISSLKALLSTASQNADVRSSELNEELELLNAYTDSAITELKILLSEYEKNDSRILDQISIDPETGELDLSDLRLNAIDTEGLSAALGDLYAQSAVLNELLGSAVFSAASDLNSVTSQMSRVFDSLSALVDSGTGTSLYDSYDLSASESYGHDMGAIAESENYGGVQGENNVGGVVGTMAFEVSFDMEDRLDASSFLTSNAKRYLFAAVRDCRSFSDILVKEERAGGVVGSMDMGAIVSCVGVGAVSSENGDYVGGVAGKAQGAILSSWSRAVLSGGKYVGGIAGEGTEVQGCVAWTRVDKASEYTGAVAGWAEGVIRGNLYVETKPAGVDGVSLSGQTDPISVAELLTMEGVPEGFGDLTVSFLVGEKVVQTVTVPFGGRIEELPAVENDGIRYWKWDEFDNEHIYRSLQIEGKYYAPGTTISSGEDPPLFLVEGLFYEGQRLTAAPYAVDRSAEEILAAYTLYVNDYEGTLTVRMRSSEAGSLYLLHDDGAPERAAYRTDGQYIVFTLPNGSSFVYVRETHSGGWWVWAGLGGGAAALALAIFLTVRKKQRSIVTEE